MQRTFHENKSRCITIEILIMVKLSEANREFRKFFRVSIKRNIDQWSENLHCYLKKYGISKCRCKQIALSRAYFAIYRQDGKLINVFDDIKGTEHAVRLYNAYIRHEYTNYDEFCEKVSSCMCEVTQMDKNEVKKMWRMQYPKEFETYERQCIFIDEKFKRVYNQHFVF